MTSLVGGGELSSVGCGLFLGFHLQLSHGMTKLEPAPKGVSAASHYIYATTDSYSKMELSRMAHTLAWLYFSNTASIAEKN